jgi:histidinol-phosphate aminotransferase
MQQKKDVNRRRFMGGLATALGLATLNPFELAALQRGQRGAAGAGAAPAAQANRVPYDAMAKLANNENPYGPSEAVLKAMNDVWKYSNRYGYPDGGIRQAIAEHHGVKPENVIISAGSGEILKVVDDTYLQNHKIVVGPDPTYGSVYQYTTNSKATAIRVPLKKDFTTDMDSIIRQTKLHYRDVGLVYICNPNNPTGNIVHKDDVRKLITSIPEEIPILMDEAYHHFVDNANYEPSIKYVLEGRRIIVARTFSKIAALAGMRLGFAIAPPDMIQEMSPFNLASMNALVKYGGIAALKDTAYEQRTKMLNKQLRDRTTTELHAYGYETIPSDANFFMVNIKTDMGPIQQKFSEEGVLVGRRFSPMDTWLRISVGTDDEMKRFVTAFKKIFPAAKPTTAVAAGA